VGKEGELTSGGKTRGNTRKRKLKMITGRGAKKEGGKRKKRGERNVPFGGRDKREFSKNRGGRNFIVKHPGEKFRSMDTQRLLVWGGGTTGKEEPEGSMGRKNDIREKNCDSRERKKGSI